jgi:hypothetical protein
MPTGSSRRLIWRSGERWDQKTIENLWGDDPLRLDGEVYTGDEELK